MRMRKGLKNKRHNLPEEVYVPVDRFSNLPDSVLCHVLSFLPETDEVVRTSILSKRWKNLWTYVNTLIFEDGKLVIPEEMQYSQYVYRVLQCHKGSIKKMVLSSPYRGGNEYDLKNWISTAIDKGVEILELRPCMLQPWWPSCLFGSETLVVLEIKGLGANIINLNIPSAPFFPSLKKLKINIPKWDTEGLERLISGCMVLENLYIRMFNDNILLKLSSPTLKRLVVLCAHTTYDINQKIELMVPALEFLKLRSPPAEIVSEDQLPFLTEVDIQILCKSMTDVNENLCRDSLVRFMEHISNVEVLRLKCDFMKPLTLAMHAKFPNLTNLEIISSLSEWTLLRSFMESSINLEFISFEQTKEKENLVCWIGPQNVPHCLLASLKKISIKGHIIENELDMVDYVLRNAEVLERMDIVSVDFDGDYEAKCRILQKLLMIKRASRGCEISFV